MKKPQQKEVDKESDKAKEVRAVQVSPTTIPKSEDKILRGTNGRVIKNDQG